MKAQKCIHFLSERYIWFHWSRFLSILIQEADRELVHNDSSGFQALKREGFVQTFCKVSFICCQTDNILGNCFC